ncbi:hypothetical protein [Micromonospora sp. CPCC 206061]|uniref:hypothetical protein n=1 Tax=Micromonospora sp. CPCC 206061 TaxID=3122410 RepID=UPI002FF36D69
MATLPLNMGIGIWAGPLRLGDRERMKPIRSTLTLVSRYRHCDDMTDGRSDDKGLPLLPNYPTEEIFQVANAEDHRRPGMPDEITTPSGTRPGPASRPEARNSAC